MSDEKQFVSGLFVNPPHEKAPDFVKMSVSFRPSEFADWLSAQEPNDKGYVRIQVKESKGGKWYAEVDNWKPDASKHDKAKADGYAPEKTSTFKDDEIPF